jgi:hypothetical protein
VKKCNHLHTHAMMVMFIDCARLHKRKKTVIKTTVTYPPLLAEKEVVDGIMGLSVKEGGTTS